jgi:toxin ParE1/3/4
MTKITTKKPAAKKSFVFKLTVRAKEDLKNIAYYTQEVWGLDQRNLYLRHIDNIFYRIAKFPEQGRICDNICQGYYKIGVGKHIIFYRQINKKEIQIVRVLHESMDIPNYF